jgi:hypothetical protein
MKSFTLAPNAPQMLKEIARIASKSQGEILDDCIIAIYDLYLHPEEPFIFNNVQTQYKAIFDTQKRLINNKPFTDIDEQINIIQTE